MKESPKLLLRNANQEKSFNVTKYKGTTKFSIENSNITNKRHHLSRVSQEYQKGRSIWKQFLNDFNAKVLQ